MAISGFDPNLLAAVPKTRKTLEIKQLTVSGSESVSRMRPIAWGSLGNQPGAHFYIRKWHIYITDMVALPSLCEKLARLHGGHTSPDGRFGFHCATYIGDMPQDNGWTDTWEAFFAQVLRRVLQLRDEQEGPDERLDALLPPALFDKVIPRLLRGLETDGRRVGPVLLHGNLWFGNCAVGPGTGDVLVYGAAAFYGHNDLGSWRQKWNRYRDGDPFEAYHRHIPRSEPVEDYDDRSTLYALKFHLHPSVLFPRKNLEM
ncbi:hypothetical protein VTH06DRAFT_5873 [Thermothelomyces fergusii]